MPTNSIKEIKEKYNVSQDAAQIIFEAAHESQVPLHTIVSLYRSESDMGKKYVSAGMLWNAIRTFTITQMSNKRPIGTMDDRSTKYVKSTFDEHGNKHYDDNGKLIPQPARFISTRKMLGADQYKEQHMQPRTISPKYYYFDLDMHFDVTGKDKPPSYDRQFRGFHEGVPYARVTVDKIISPSHYPIPITDESGKVIGREKTKGYRLLNVDVFYGGHSQTIQLKAPYENIASFDVGIGQNVIKEIHHMLNVMMTDNVKMLYEHIKNDKNAIHIIEAIDTSDYDKKMATARMLEEYYGKDYKNSDRKRKSTKPSPKRHTIIKKKVKRKCVCKPPTQHKRKVAAIKKKLTRKVKRR
jgi:hypothetical protein